MGTHDEEINAWATLLRAGHDQLLATIAEEMDTWERIAVEARAAGWSEDEIRTFLAEMDDKCYEEYPPEARSDLREARSMARDEVRAAHPTKYTVA